ncbi:hypothetical protein IMSAGC017_02378 [Thomasclavelia cocleata]|uniref:RNA polymerase sigma-70 region 4 domain-containing protein n=1 Tax=Thomasclavelia cocleata TaxID=69824 RepID=A0A829ZCP5_9FIRM|nr:sigma-70 family RNA polymerase sigma factor [Thomasclavelia cocleata]GFI42330.1 hypothetical protein IMSAGC017_02378 [Thomasclavelia cocleata]
MNNDYQRHDFAEIVKEGERMFYIKVNNKWVQVTREVFRVCKSSYLKILKENKQESNILEHYEDVNNFYPITINRNDIDMIEQLYKKEKLKQLSNLLQTLNDEERKIIQWIYFEYMTEQKVATLLHTTRLKVNYKKRKILKKLYELFTTL